MAVEPEFFSGTFDTNLKQRQVCESGFCMNKEEIWSVIRKKPQGHVPSENVPK